MPGLLKESGCEFTGLRPFRRPPFWGWGSLVAQSQDGTVDEVCTTHLHGIVLASCTSDSSCMFVVVQIAFHITKKLAHERNSMPRQRDGQKYSERYKYNLLRGVGTVLAALHEACCKGFSARRLLQEACGMLQEACYNERVLLHEACCKWLGAGGLLQEACC